MIFLFLICEGIVLIHWLKIFKKFSSPFEQYVVLHLNKLEPPVPRKACFVKMFLEVKIYKRRFSNIVDVFTQLLPIVVILVRIYPQ